MPAGCRCVAGPVEATAIGNVLVQARARGLLAGDLEDAARARPRDAATSAAIEPRTAAARGRDLTDARRAVHHVLQRHAVPGGRPGDRGAPPSAWAGRGLPGRARRAAGRCTSTRATGTTASRWSGGSSRCSRASTRSSRHPPRARRWSATSTRSSPRWRPGTAIRCSRRRGVGGPAGAGAVRVPGRHAGCDRCRRDVPAHRRAASDLPLVAAARGRGSAGAAVGRRRRADPRRRCHADRAAASAARSRSRTRTPRWRWAATSSTTSSHRAPRC